MLKCKFAGVLHKRRRYGRLKSFRFCTCERSLLSRPNNMVETPSWNHLSNSWSARFLDTGSGRGRLLPSGTIRLATSWDYSARKKLEMVLIETSYGPWNFHFFFGERITSWSALFFAEDYSCFFMPRDPLRQRTSIAGEGGGVLNRTREVSRFKRILNISNGIFYALVCC